MPGGLQSWRPVYFEYHMENRGENMLMTKDASFSRLETRYEAHDRSAIRLPMTASTGNKNDSDDYFLTLFYAFRIRSWWSLGLGVITSA